jgi:hypothetical protein
VIFGNGRRTPIFSRSRIAARLVDLGIRPHVHRILALAGQPGVDPQPLVQPVGEERDHRRHRVRDGEEHREERGVGLLLVALRARVAPAPVATPPAADVPVVEIVAHALQRRHGVGERIRVELRAELLHELLHAAPDPAIERMIRSHLERLPRG